MCADEETFAIKQHNITHLNELALTKNSLIDAIILASQVSEITLDNNSAFNARFSALTKQLSDNSQAMADSLKTLYQKIMDNQFFWKKIKAFKSVYASEEKTTNRFRA